MNAIPRAYQRELILLAAIGIVCVIFASRSEFFISERNLVTVLRNSVDLAVISAGMTLVIAMGGIDVSVGGILAVSAIIIGRAYQAEWPDAVVVVLGLATGCVLGALNGTVCAKLRVPPIIATLGSMYIFIAVLFLVIGGTWISGLPGTLSFLILGEWLGLPAGVYIIGVVYLLCWAILRRHVWGRHLLAVGSDEPAARLVGIDVDWIKIRTYTLLGLLAGIAAVLYVARLRNVEVNIGTNIALEAIAATILGGADIRGGVGSLAGTLLGVLFIKLMQNGLVLSGVSSLWETVIIGGLLLAVLTLDALQGRRVRV